MGFSLKKALGSTGGALGLGGAANMMVGSSIGAIGDVLSANSAASKSKRQAQWAWNQQMNADNTKYQRTMADMEAAGLNPILGMSEAGAASPGSATPGQSFQANAGTGLLNGLNAAANLQNAESTARSSKATSAASEAQAIKTLYEAGLLSKFGGRKAAAEISNLTAQTAGTEERTKTQKFVNKMGGHVDKGMGTLGQIAEGMGQGIAQVYDEMSYNSKNRKYHSAKNSREAWHNIMN